MRNPHITIIKALAITLVVMAHSCPPLYLSRFCYMLCVSLFFVCSGYCFNTDYLSKEATFVGRRFKGLYLPFVKWSIFFLVLNHFWFYTSILNEQFGNASNGVTHPLNLHQGLQSLWSIVFNMSGYDQFLCGAFWFFRALLVSSIAFLVLFKLIDTLDHFRSRHTRSAVAIASLALILAVWQTSDGLKVTGLAQGGYRDLMGIAFLAVGFLFKQYHQWLSAQPLTSPLIPTDSIQRPKLRKAAVAANTAVAALQRATRWLGHKPIVSMIISAVILGLLVYFPHPAMTLKAATIADVLWLFLSGAVGFSFVYNLAHMLDRIIPLRRPLYFVGANTLTIFVWHLFAFKLVSMIKVGVYHLPWAMVGCHTTVHGQQGPWFWLLYTLVGISLPLGCLVLTRYLRSHYTRQDVLSLCRWVALRLGAGFWFFARWIVYAGKLIVLKTWSGLRWLALKAFNSVYSFCIDFKDTIVAGADVTGKQDEEEDYDEDDEEEDVEEEYEEDEEEEDNSPTAQ